MRVTQLQMTLKDYIGVLKIASYSFHSWYLLIMMFFYPLYGKVEKIKLERKVVAFAIYSFGKLHFFAVHQNHHRQGLGKKLIYKIKNELKFLRVVKGNEKACSFFKSVGFERISEKLTFLGRRIVMKPVQS